MTKRSFYKNVSPTYTYGYGLIIIPRVYTNAYWSDTYKQTYEPMYGYYKHENYFNAKGYYSDKFSKIFNGPTDTSKRGKREKDRPRNIIRGIM